MQTHAAQSHVRTALRVLTSIVCLMEYPVLGQNPGASTVYRDRLENGFQNWSWGEHEPFQNREVEEGSAALSFTPSNYSGLYLKQIQSPLASTEFSAITFAIKSSASSPQQVRVGIGEYESDRALSTLVNIEPGRWQRLTIRFQDMDSSIGSSFDKIYIQGGAATTRGTFFVDSIYLIRSTNSPVPQPSPPVPSPSPAPSPPEGTGTLRPLSKRELMFSLQDVLALPKPPLLETFREQNSKTQVYRNSYDVIQDSANLRALERDIQAVVASINLRSTSRRLINCDLLAAPMCRETFFQRIATHAWRRPLLASDRNAIRAIVDNLSKVEDSAIEALLRQALVAMFFDHRFLYRHELGIELSGNRAPQNRLAIWERLTAVSYALAQRPPSYEQILQLGRDGSTSPDWRQLVKNMVQSPSFAAPLSDFLSQWLMIYDLEYALIPAASQWNPAMARGYLAEMESFVAQTLREDDSLYALLTRPQTEAGNFAYGIFGTRAFLTASGKNTQASMILRGVRILRHALCQTLPPPPPTMDTQPPATLDPNDPLYDEKIVLMHTSRAACKGCHARIDPAGLALQTYDGLGRNRSRMVDFENLGLSPSFSVSLGNRSDVISVLDPGLFAESMARSEVFALCFARQSLRFVLGREPSPQEIRLADDLASQYLDTNRGGRDSLAAFFEAMLTRDDLFTR